jgi:hypothetical protein
MDNRRGLHMRIKRPQKYVAIVLSDELLVKIHDWRRRMPVPPNMSASVRHLITKALGGEAEARK